MKIYSNLPLNHVRELTLHMNSADLNFKWVMVNPADDDREPGTLEFRDMRCASLTFRDIYELEIFIEMLESFRTECVNGFGDWGVVKNDHSNG